MSSKKVPGGAEVESWEVKSAASGEAKLSGESVVVQNGGELVSGANGTLGVSMV